MTRNFLFSYEMPPWGLCNAFFNMSRNTAPLLSSMIVQWADRSHSYRKGSRSRQWEGQHSCLRKQGGKMLCPSWLPCVSVDLILLWGSKRRYSNSFVIALFSSGFNHYSFILLVMVFIIRDRVTSELPLSHSVPWAVGKWMSWRH